MPVKDGTQLSQEIVAFKKKAVAGDNSELGLVAFKTCFLPDLLYSVQLSSDFKESLAGPISLTMPKNLTYHHVNHQRF